MRPTAAFEAMLARHFDAPTFEELEEAADQAQTEYEDRADEARKERNWT